jgi:hypothetical protein
LSEKQFLSWANLTPIVSASPPILTCRDWLIPSAPALQRLESRDKPCLSYLVTHGMWNANDQNPAGFST